MEPVASFQGLASGIRFRDLVDQIIAAESRPVVLLEQKKVELDREVTAWTDFEFLNGEIFYTLPEAVVPIEQWRRLYNTVRPQSAYGGRPPAPETGGRSGPTYLGFGPTLELLASLAGAHRTASPRRSTRGASASPCSASRPRRWSASVSSR